MGASEAHKTWQIGRQSWRLLLSEGTKQLWGIVGIGVSSTLGGTVYIQGGSHCLNQVPNLPSQPHRPFTAEIYRQKPAKSHRRR